MSGSENRFSGEVVLPGASGKIMSANLDNNYCGQEQDQACETQFHFLEGWFDQMFDSGRTPFYGYPANHHSEPKVESMDIETTFFSRSQAKA